ncbi:MAG: hypothetical protein A2162_02690 [Deltaproteobacteria bacterium RBG_13_52_11b]|nr:MAG: hypothetical protein A2162_02690 [Deltaproteobacteria bacterium RBG_13_52_11b]
MISFLVLLWVEFGAEFIIESLWEDPSESLLSFSHEMAHLSFQRKKSNENTLCSYEHSDNAELHFLNDSQKKHTDKGRALSFV